jgi:hypothetical protein
LGLIGLGTLLVGYFFPNKERELTDAVNQFKKASMGKNHQKLLNNLKERWKDSGFTQ